MDLREKPGNQYGEAQAQIFFNGNVFDRSVG